MVQNQHTHNYANEHIAKLQKLSCMFGKKLIKKTLRGQSLLCSTTHTQLRVRRYTTTHAGLFLAYYLWFHHHNYINMHTCGI